ncbi:MAG: hypothetical protein IKT98_00290, partial [Selenomonadaceae bacterium]|nr:hypothetical protein [Selenomonadaceae bacterium]
MKEKLTAGGYVKLGNDIETTYCVVLSKEVTLDLNGKTLTSTKSDPFDVKTKFTLNDSAGTGKIVATGSYPTIYMYSAGTFIMNGGSIESTKANIKDAGKITINGGSFKSSDATSDDIVKKYIASGTNSGYYDDVLCVGSSVPTSGYTYTANLDGTTKHYSTQALADAATTNAVAQIGNVKYSSLQKAVNEAANSGDTIKILKDINLSTYITIGKDLTIDLNGKTITSTGSYAFYVSASGTLTLNDSSDNGKILHQGSSSAIYMYSTTSKFAMNGGTIESTKAVNINDKGTITINGGSFKSGNVTNDAIIKKYITSGKNSGYYDDVLCVGSSIPTSGYTYTATLDGTTKHYSTQALANAAVANAVAQIGDVNYSTLNNAADAAKDNDTIKILKDVTLTGAVNVSKKITLDLNGKTVSYAGSNAFYVKTVDGSQGDLTVKDSGTGGKITAGDYAINAGGSNTSQGKFTLESGTIEATNSSGYAIRVYGGSIVDINGGNVTSKSYTVYASSANSTTNINGGTLTSEKSCIYLPSGANLNVTGGTITGDPIISASVGSTVSIDNGTGYYKASIDGKINYYSTQALADAAVAGAVAQIGDMNYSTLSKAISAASDTDVIKIVKDFALSSTVNISKNVTLDLNGKTISYTGSGSSGYPLYISKGELTINDSSGNNSGCINANANYAVVIYPSNPNTAKLTINGGTFKSNGYTITGNGTCTWDNAITITINGGVIEGRQLGVYFPGEGILNVNGGTITGATGVEMRAGSINATGGTIVGTGTSYSSDPNGNGSTSSGAGIAISQHTTKKAVTVNISGENTEIKGTNAVAVSNPQDNAKNLAIEVTVDGATLTSTKTDATKNQEGNAILSDNANVSITVNNGKLEGNVAVTKDENPKADTNNTTITMNGGTTTGNVINAGSGDSKVEISGTAEVQGDVKSSGDAPTAISGGEVKGTVKNESANAKTEISGGTVKNVESSNGETKISGAAKVTETVTTSGGTTEINGGEVKNVTSSGGETTVTGTAKVTETVTTSGGTTEINGGEVKNVTSSAGSTTVTGTAKVKGDVENSGGTTNVTGGEIKGSVKSTGAGTTTNVSGGIVNGNVTSDENARTAVSGGKVSGTIDENALADGYKKDDNGIIRANAKWVTVSADRYNYVLTGTKTGSTLSKTIAAASVSAGSTLTLADFKDDTQYKLLGIPTGAASVSTDGKFITDNSFAAAQYDTSTAGTVAITPLTAGFKIIGTTFVGDATKLTTSDDTNKFGIEVDATDNKLTDITGGAGNDSLLAGKNGGTLRGGAGDDTLAGGDGAASLIGGDGSDTFVYTAGKDTIDSFATGDVVKTSGLVVTDGSKITTVKDNDFALDFGDGKTLTFTSTTVPISLNNGTSDYIYTKDYVKQDQSMTISSAITTFSLNADAYKEIEKVDGSAVTGNLAITDNSLGNYMVAGQGVNTFNYSNGGNDIIEGYDASDVVSVSNFTPLTSFDHVNYANMSDYKIEFGAGNSLTFKGVLEVSLLNTADGKTDTYTYKTTSIAKEKEGITLGSAYSGNFDGRELEYATIDATEVEKKIRIRGNNEANYIIGSKVGGTLEGNNGNDTLKATNGETTLNGGNGNDSLVGGSGNDVFIYSSGVDSISGYGSGDLVKVTAANIKPSEAIFTSDANNISLTFSDENKLIFENVNDSTISLKSDKNTFIYTKNYVMLNDKGITLAADYGTSFDGTADSLKTFETVDASAVGNAISIVGNDNGNYIIGSSTKANSLAGGKGNDTLVGGKVADIFFHTGGKDFIEGFGTGDSLSIDSNKIQKAKANSSKFVLTMSGKNDVLTFKSEGETPEKISLVDGGYLTKDGVVKDNNFKLFSSAKGKIEIAEGITSVNASAADKQSVTLVAGSVASGSTLDVTFASNNKKKDSFEYGGGNVSISGYEGGKDKINLGDALISGFSVTDKTVAISVSGGVISIAGAQGEEVLIHQDGVNKGNSYSKMVFKETGVLENKKKNPTQATIIEGVVNGFSAVNDATVKDIKVSSGVSAVSIQAGDKNNTLIDASAAGGVSLYGGKKNDKLTGSETAADTFVYTGGKDVIMNYGYSTGDSISFDATKFDVDSAKITASKKSIKFKFNSKSTLMLKGDGISGNKIKINDTEYVYAKNAIINGESSVSLTSAFSGTYKIDKDDKTTLVDGHLVKKSLTLKGTSAAEKLIGGTSKTTFKGGGGKDTLVGGDGKDTFFFAKGDKDTVTIQNFDFTNDKLKLADGILKEI